MSKLTAGHIEAIRGDAEYNSVHITNAFSINMLQSVNARINFIQLDDDDVKAIFAPGANVVSHIGHADTAGIVGGIIGREVPMSRIAVKLCDYLIVAQYAGPRLPEGTTVLPEGAAIVFWLVENGSIYN